MISNKIKSAKSRSFSGVACAFGLIMVVYGTDSLAADYYVAKTGDNSNSGTLSQPWATISKANSTVKAGDTVYIRAGTYSETIEPANSGQAGKRITFKNYASEKVMLTGAAPESSVVHLGGDYITVDGLHLKQAVPGKNSDNVYISGSHNEILNCRIVNDADAAKQALSGISELGIIVMGGNRNRIEGNHVEGLSKQGIKFRKGGRFNIVRDNTVINHYGDAIRIDSGAGVLQSLLIENNRLGGSMRSDGIQTNANFDLEGAEREADVGTRGIIIRNNQIFDNAENGIDIKGTSNIVIEGNYIHGNRGDNDGSVNDAPDRITSGGAIHKGSRTSSRDIIIRNNIVFDNNNGVNLIDGWFIYNNTIISNNRDYTGPNSDFTVPGQPFFSNIAGSNDLGTMIKNNIIGDAAHAELSFSPESKAEIDNNLYFNSSGKVIFGVNEKGIPWLPLEFNEWKTMLATLPGIIGLDAGSKVGDPKFVNVPPRPIGTDSNLDFRLSADSPAIDAGAELTRTAGSGSGNRITLKEAGYFYDGFGVTSGDLIKVGSNDPVRITAVDYAADTVVVDRSISWGNNDPVHLPFQGSAPDIGAVPYIAENPTPPSAPSVPSAPSGLTLEVHAP